MIISCPKCASEYEVADDTVGSNALCENCNTEFIIQKNDSSSINKAKAESVVVATVRNNAGSEIDPAVHRNCVYCDEIIKTNAKICRFCKKQLPGVEQVEHQNKPAPLQNEELPRKPRIKTPPQRIIEQRAEEEPIDEVQEFHDNLKSNSSAPIVTYCLLAANIIVMIFIACKGVNIFSPTNVDLLKYGASYGPATILGDYWRFVTPIFLHIGIIHLAVNSWALYELGTVCERMCGKLSFLTVYLFSGIAGCIASLYYHPEMVSAGASGSIFGVAGCTLGILLLNRESLPKKVFLSLTKGLGILIAYNIIYGLSSSGIDNAAHIGGLAMGFIYGLMFIGRPIFPLIILIAAGFILFKKDFTRMDLLYYINVQLPSVAQVEKEACEEYNNRIVLKTGNTNDDNIGNDLSNHVIPAFEKYIKELIKIKPKSNAVFNIHKRCIRTEGFKIWALYVMAAYLEGDNINYKIISAKILSEKESRFLVSLKPFLGNMERPHIDSYKTQPLIDESNMELKLWNEEIEQLAKDKDVKLVTRPVVPFVLFVPDKYNISKDIIKYVNSAIQSIAVIEKQADSSLTKLNELLESDEIKSQKDLSNQMLNNVIPAYGKLLIVAKAVKPKTKELNDIHNIYVNAVELKLGALKALSIDYLSESVPSSMKKSDNLLMLYSNKLKELMDKNGIKMEKK